MGTFCPGLLTCQIASHLGESCLAVSCGGMLPLRTKLRTMFGITVCIIEVLTYFKTFTAAISLHYNRTLFFVPNYTI